mmetsp:Transcript_12536/g.15575  ORF Transcript_12536/g.15575 Transcript_12536/m.15575 type:complete len:120 (-) Transcript_12536:214-573(-)
MSSLCYTRLKCSCPGVKCKAPPKKRKQAVYWTCADCCTATQLWSDARLSCGKCYGRYKIYDRLWKCSYDENYSEASIETAIASMSSAVVAISRGLAASSNSTARTIIEAAQDALLDDLS